MEFLTICKISDLERQIQKFAKKDPGQQFEKFAKKKGILNHNFQSLQKNEIQDANLKILQKMI